MIVILGSQLDFDSWKTSFARAGRPRLHLLQQIGLLADNSCPEGLELEPAGHVRSDLLTRDFGVRCIDLHRVTCSLGHQLSLATSFHGNEPPGRFVHGLTYGQQPMITKNHRFPVPQDLSDALAFGSFVDYAGEIWEKRVIFVERADILRDGIKQAAERGPS